MTPCDFRRSPWRSHTFVTTSRWLILIVGFAGVVATGCATGSSDPAAAGRARALHEALVKQLEPKPSQAASSLTKQVKDLQPDAPTDALEHEVPKLVATMSRIPAKEIGVVYQALMELRRQPNVITAFISYFSQLTKDAYPEQIFTVRIIGELQRTDAHAFLTALIWESLPDFEPHAEERLTRRQHAEMLKSVAISGLAYMRAPEGTPFDDSMTEVFRVLQTHPSRAVRIAAIDAYMWNNNDHPKIAERLYQALPSEFHPFVERARFYRGMNQAVFDAGLSEWRRKWAR